MNFAIAAAVSAILLMIVSQIQRRSRNDASWLKTAIIVLRVVVLGFVALYLYERLAS